jgi:hypothetical protein
MVRPCSRWRKPALVVVLPALLAFFGCGRVQSDEGPDTCSCPRTVSFEEFKAGIFEADLFSGGPSERFEDVGRNTLATSIRLGLMPDHRLLDIGAGSLRVGWWLVQYLDPENYYAIEPVASRIDKAEEILGAKIHIYYNEDFEFPDVEFDFVLARSIWTHASKAMISKMLSEFSENSAPDAKFLTSFIPSRSEREDYKGNEWVGRVNKNDKARVIRHSLAWIQRECEKFGLTVEEVGLLHKQTWLLVQKQPRIGDEANG